MSKCPSCNMDFIFNLRALGTVIRSSLRSIPHGRYVNMIGIEDFSGQALITFFIRNKEEKSVNT